MWTEGRAGRIHRGAYDPCGGDGIRSVVGVVDGHATQVEIVHVARDHRQPMDLGCGQQQSVDDVQRPAQALALRAASANPTTKRRQAIAVGHLVERGEDLVPTGARSAEQAPPTGGNQGRCASGEAHPLQQPREVQCTHYLVINDQKRAIHFTHIPSLYDIRKHRCNELTF